jgi:hypothetical protein
MGEKFTSSLGQATPSHAIWPLDAKSIPRPMSNQTFKVCPQVINAEAASSWLIRRVFQLHLSWNPMWRPQQLTYTIVLLGTILNPC